MLSPQNWRDYPAEIVEEVITCHTYGKYPPTMAQMERIAQTYRYHVFYVSPHLLPTALTFHEKRAILVPDLDDIIKKADMLLHEIFEVLLRLPVAEEVYYTQSDADEFHNVSCVGVKRAQLLTRGEL